MRNKYTEGCDKFDYIQPLEANPIEVKVVDFDRAFKAFRAIVQKEKILSLFKEKQRYEKPSDKKRRKRNEAERKKMELELKDRLYKSGKLKTKKRKDEIQE